MFGIIESLKSIFFFILHKGRDNSRPLAFFISYNNTEVLEIKPSFLQKKKKKTQTRGHLAGNRNQHFASS